MGATARPSRVNDDGRAQRVLSISIQMAGLDSALAAAAAALALRAGVAVAVMGGKGSSEGTRAQSLGLSGSGALGSMTGRVILPPGPGATTVGPISSTLQPTWRSSDSSWSWKA